MSHLERYEGVRWGLPANGDALAAGEPCTPAVVSRLLLEPCCLLKLPFALLLRGAGLPFEMVLDGELEKGSGWAVRLSGDPVLVKELDRRGRVDRLP